MEDMERLVSLYNEDSWIQTFSGKKIFPLNPNPNDIDIVDIVSALSKICRFTGHCKKFYSVAQHCVLVSYICNNENALYGLLHDFSEAYLNDISSPLKRLPEFSLYRVIEKNMQSTIYKKFGLEPHEPPDVKRADILLLATEARDLMGPLHQDWNASVKPLPFKIDPWGPEVAEKMLMERFNELYYK